LEDWKIKISVLWLFNEVAGLGGVILMLLEKDVLAELVEHGTIEGMLVSSPEYLLVGAIAILIPLVMAFLTLTLKDSTNRWANIIVGLVSIGLGVSELPTYLAKPSAYGGLMMLAGWVALALIVWYAWKSKQKT